MRVIINALLIAVLLDCLSAQSVGVRMEMIYAPVLTEEIRTSKSIPSPPQYIFFDPEIGKYVARYIPEKSSGQYGDPVIVPIRFRVETEVVAEVAIQRNSNDYQYRWLARNMPSAKYASRMLSIALPLTDQELKCSSPLNYPPATIQSRGPTAARQLSESPAVSRLSLGGWRFALLGYPTDSPLQPGAEGGGWICQSKFLPGWVTAYSNGGEDTVLPDAPFAVHEQLSKIRTFERFFQPTITYGPKYPPEAPERIIALDFLHGLASMEATRQLDPQSDFSKKLRTSLERIVAEEEVRKVEGLQARSKFEAELLAVLQLTLSKFF